jgi:hypothetical protein
VELPDTLSMSCSSSTPIEASNVSLIRSITMAACCAVLAPPANSAIAKTSFQPATPEAARGLSARYDCWRARTRLRRSLNWRGWRCLPKARRRVLQRYAKCWIAHMAIRTLRVEGAGLLARPGGKAKLGLTKAVRAQWKRAAATAAPPKPRPKRPARRPATPRSARRTAAC